MRNWDYTLWSHPHAREGIMHGERGCVCVCGWLGLIRVRFMASVERDRVRYS